MTTPTPKEEKKFKRSSFFGIFNHKDKQADKSDKHEKPKPAEKKPEEYQPVSSTAPQLDSPVAPEPIAAEDVTKSHTEGAADPSTATEGTKEGQEAANQESQEKSEEKGVDQADKSTEKSPEKNEKLSATTPTKGMFSKFLKKDKSDVSHLFLSSILQHIFRHGRCR